jgi:ankyrin repeat protein
LLESNADINIRSFDGKTPLMYAAMRGFVGAATALIEAKADLDAQDIHGSHAYLLARQRKNYIITKLLQNAGAAVFPARSRVEKSQHMVEEALADAGLVVRDETNAHYYPMHRALYKAIVNDDVDLARATVHKYGTAGFDTVALHFAKSVDAVEFLLEHGADIEGRRNGKTPLMSLASASRSPPVRKLLELKADVHAVTEDLETALSFALRGKGANVELLLEHGADFRGTVGTQQTPYMLMAARLNKHTFLQAVIDSKADVNCADIGGVTPIAGAAQTGDLRTVQMLLDAKADIHVADARGRTPFSAAVVGNKPEVIQLLISHGADPCGVSVSGHTIAMAAVRNPHKGVMQLLVDAKADIHVVKKTGHTALSTAIMFNSADAVNTLIRNKADVNQADRFNVSPLMLAARAGNLPSTLALLRAGADVMARDDKGTSAYDSAVKLGVEPVVEAIRRHMDMVEQGKQSPEAVAPKLFKAFEPHPDDYI